MKHLRQTLALALFAGAAMAGTQARAIEPGFLSCTVIGTTPDTVFISAVVDPTLADAFATVTYAPLPGPGMLVGATVLCPGPNILAVPNFNLGGTYTVEAAGRKSVAENEPGLN